VADDDIKLHNYQDDLDTDPGAVDPLIGDEEPEEPADLFGIPEDEYKDELDKLDIDDGIDDEDERENIEDVDEDLGDTTKY
jgi:hypothetical protein